MFKPFEVFDHTADIGIVAYGNDLVSLFSNAATGMISLMLKMDRRVRNVTRAISLTAEDNEALLIAWLNELLYIIYTDKLVLHGFDMAIDKGRLTAKCAGQRLEEGRSEFTREIKAATYHNLTIVYKEGVYSAKVIFDI